MQRKFKVIIERDNDLYIGYCPEVPGENGQGASLEECVESLQDAIRLIVKVRTDDGPDSSQDITKP